MAIFDSIADWINGHATLGTAKNSIEITKFGYFIYTQTNKPNWLRNIGFIGLDWNVVNI